MNPIFVGIGVGSQHNAVYLMNPGGSKHGSFPVQNNRGRAKLLVDKIVLAVQSQGLTDMVIGMETTSIYGDCLIYALHDYGDCINQIGPSFLQETRNGVTMLWLWRQTGESRTGDCRIG